jgi:hypothetical protein
MARLVWVSDPGHAWLSVSVGDIAKVGLSARSFSNYSYVSRDSNRFYLEEDCDAGVYIKAYREKFNSEPVIREGNGRADRSYVRSLPSIRYAA